MTDKAQENKEIVRNVFTNTYCHVIRLQDGKFVESTEYFDTALAIEALGPER